MDGALRAAVQAGDTGAVRALILRKHAKQRAAVGLGRESDLSALQLASLYDDAAATLLLESGVACDLHSACALGLSGDITRLAARGDLGAAAEHLTPMGFALTKARLDAVQALLKAGDDPNRPLRRMRTSFGRSRRSPPVMVTGRRCRPVAEAVRRMSSPEGAEHASGLTPAMVAAREGGVDALRWFLARGADANARDDTGSTLLHAASRPWWGEQPELVSILLAAGADREARDQAGRTPRDLAVDAGFAATADLLAA